MLKKLLLVIGCIVVAVILFIGIVMYIIASMPAVPENYSQSVRSGGAVEGRFIAEGDYGVENIEFAADSPINKITVFYPQKAANRRQDVPLVIFVNGTGILPEKYISLMRHLASWGFVAVGNDDPSTGTGVSTNHKLDLVIRESLKPDSRLFDMIDTSRIGISGHSQGGAGVLNAISDSLWRPRYKAAVALSPTHDSAAVMLKFPYDMRQIRTPLLLLAGTEGDFETKFVIPIEAMKRMYANTVSPAVMARRNGADHGQMLYMADGYVTAWFRWQLQGDSVAAKAFTGANPELNNNPMYRDVEIGLR